MPRPGKSKPAIKLPDVRPGTWRREILDGCTLNFGQVVQPGPPRQSVEFTYMIIPSALTMREVHFTWPGIGDCHTRANEDGVPGRRTSPQGEASSSAEGPQLSHVLS